MNLRTWIAQEEARQIASVPPLQISSELAEAMVKKSNLRVSEDTGVSIPYLLDMIELKREFNRPVLRYLGYRREVIYYRATD